MALSVTRSLHADMRDRVQNHENILATRVFNKFFVVPERDFILPRHNESVRTIRIEMCASL